MENRNLSLDLRCGVMGDTVTCEIRKPEHISSSAVDHGVALNITEKKNREREARGEKAMIWTANSTHIRSPREKGEWSRTDMN